MMMRIERKTYLELNNSFKRKMVFRLGYDAGFFSEFNVMILAAVYCLKNNIRFAINSNYGNFKYKEGWKDFFIPFFPEDNRIFNKHYNFRPYNRKRRLLQEKFFKKLYKVDFLTQDLWNNFRSPQFWQEDILISNLSIKKSFFECCGMMVKMSYRFKPEIIVEISKFIDEINLPHQFLAMHIRRGDKKNETELSEVDKYFDVAKRKSGLRDIFIFTDDYTTILEAETKYSSEWNIYHKVSPDVRGYFHTQFSSQTSQKKYDDLIYLFCNVEIMNRAEIFIGTISTNIGMFLGMKRENKSSFYIDSPTWQVA